MSFLGKARKCDLIELAKEIGETVPPDAIVVSIKNIITQSKNYDEEFVKQLLERIIEERIKCEEKIERERLQLIQEREIERQIEERDKEAQRQIEERDKQREFELQKLKLLNETENSSQTQTDGTVITSEAKSIDIRQLMQKFDLKEGEISSFLILFERQAKRIGLKEDDYVFHLLGLLPLEITQLIARESEEEASKYAFVKNLLLKRFKLSPEKFRQKFVNHTRDFKNTWSDFVFEMRNYFNEWLDGLKINDFDSLKELIITDQLKKRVPNFMREHFIDSWPNYINANDLAQKLDEYENVRSGIKVNSENKSTKFLGQYDDSKNYSRTNFRNVSRHESNKFENKNTNYKKSYEKEMSPKNSEANRSFNSSIRNEKGEPKCFGCNFFGHFKRDCPFPCELCGQRGHTKKYCRMIRKETSVNVCEPESSMAAGKYLRDAVINSCTVSSLLDTGASACLLKESIAERLRLKVSPCKKDLYSFGNQNYPTCQSLGVAITDFQVDDIIGKDISVLIVPDSTQPVDLIIGRTFLDLPYIAYARVGETLHIGYAKDYPFIGLDCIEETKSIKLQTDEATKIINNSVNFVKVKTDEVNNGIIMLQGNGSNFDSLLEIKEGKTIMPIVNIGDKEITLKQNQNMGKAELVDEINLESNVNDLNLNSFNDNRSLEILNVSTGVTSVKRDPITLEQIKINKDLTEQQRNEIVKLLNEYRDCFALNISELGCTGLTKMDIKEIEGSKPVSMKPYKTNAAEREAIKEIVSEWKENGIVTETRSPYASPVLLVRKKTGENRLVIDYRKLNNQTIKDKFPLPKIDDLLEQLHNCTMYSTLDLAHGYLQIGLTEDAKQKTAFITPDETGQFERMIFGLTNAPAEFQRLMYHALGCLCNKDVLCYLDDILVHAKTWEEMIQKLIKVFKSLRAANLTLKLTKCEFAKSEVEFLGFVIDKNGIKPGSRKVEVISKFPQPTNLHEVRRFLGLTSFFRRFIRNYAIKAKPLTELTKKNVEFRWKEEQKQSFENLKNELAQQPTLALYNPDAKTEVHTDASAEGIAGMLLQVGSDNKWHLVYCVSKKNTEAERNYHSSKLELMAIVWTLERLRQFLLGINFVVVTDCQALVYMNAKKSSNPQIARWSILIQEYNFEVRHKPGIKMAHIDALSRAPVSESEDTMSSLIEKKFEVCLTLSEDEQVLIIQHADKDLRKLIEIFKKEEHDRSNEEKQKITNYVLKRNRLFRKVKEKDKEKLLYVIPKAMRKSTAVKFHDLMGHFSVDRTVSKIKELYWFPYMKRYLRKHISMCFECLMNKTPGGKQQGYLHPIKPGKRPFSIIHMDHLGPFVKSSRGNQHLFVIIDNFTRFVKLIPVKNTSSQHVLKALKNFAEEFGLPDRIISDRGSCYTSQQFEQYCNNNGINHTLNSTQHPRGNGMVERCNRSILSTITTSMTNSRHKDWDLRIKETERNLNNSVNRTTGKTPFEILHGYSPRFNDGILRKVGDESADEWTDPKEIQHKIRSVIDKKQHQMKEYHDKKKCRTVTFEPGEIVVVRRLPKSTGEPTKTQAKYRGPLIVAEVLPNDTYRVTQLEETEKGRFYATTAHVSQLKPWRLHILDSDSDEEESDSFNDTQVIQVKP